MPSFEDPRSSRKLVVRYAIRQQKRPRDDSCGHHGYDAPGDDQGRDVHHVTVGTKAVGEIVEGVEATDDKKPKSQKYIKPSADTIEKEETTKATTETAKSTSNPQETTEVTTEVTTKDVPFTTEVTVQTTETTKTEQGTCQKLWKGLS
ncbi:unnamed protein product [Phytophthora fragariaefolia]|uniref:Unnamed protein product n=1 Tax=Phytophthora fragariaefolia TaxID=1490495 RepID=A0A9W6XKH7_9STRA|nr:unnamed protein product [Phytophthora fragariaefolia]